MRKKLEDFLRNNGKNIKRLRKAKIALALARYKLEAKIISLKEYIKLVNNILAYLNKTLDNVQENIEEYYSMMRDL